MLLVLNTMVASFVASLGFGVLFNIRGNKLFLAGIGGSIGGGVYTFMLYLGYGEMVAMFFASVAFSLYSEVIARMIKTPVTVFIICALIPLVPGGGMYRTMLQAIQGHAFEALTLGLNTLSIAGILVLGILVVSTMMRAFYKTKTKQVKE